jgi:hypothetical protein
METIVVSDDVRCLSTAVNIDSGCDDDVVPVDDGEGVCCCPKSKGEGGTSRTEGAFMRVGLVVEDK